MRALIIGLLLALSSCAPPAFAACQRCDELGASSHFTFSGRSTVLESALDLCAREPAICRSEPERGLIVATDQLMTVLEEINVLVNLLYPAKSDQETYGKSEHWALPTRAADCEDYVLAKRDLLLKAGIPSGNLRMIIVQIVKTKEWHAILSVTTDRGLYLLDNRHDRLLTIFSPVGYRFSAIQRPGQFDLFDEVNGVRM